MKIQQTGNVNFGILKGRKVTEYGERLWGEYKGYNIEVYNATKYNQRLVYVSDKVKRFVKSKLIYFQNGIKKVTRSENNAKNDRLDLR